jgi:hypothetical protein
MIAVFMDVYSSIIGVNSQAQTIPSDVELSSCGSRFSGK